MRSAESISIGINQEVATRSVVHEAIRKQKTQSNTQILQDQHKEVVDYLSQHISIEKDSTSIISTNKSEVLTKIPKNVRSLVNLKQINDVRFINKYLIKANEALPDAGIYIGCVETTSIRKRNHYAKSKNIFKKLVWLYNFIIHRVWPKVPHIRNVYFYLTKARYRWLTIAEVLGRVVSCGFETIEYKEINGRVYFVVMKTKPPFENFKPSFSPVFAMKRVGKGGKLIKVYKLRTMHPYAEFLQDYVVSLNGYNEVGKPANDFRLTSWGQKFRKYWLDEVPQFLNVLKGDLAIVGVRPLSMTRFNELPKEVQEKRIKFRPGCIPPYVALNMPDKDGNIEAEIIYMNEKEKHPYTTDLKYFFKAVYNILSGQITSS